MQISDILILMPESTQIGMKYEQLCADWCRWLLSIPKERNPAFDINGEFAAINQNNDDVFFLCQTLEASNPIPNRQIRIPAGRKIFLPIINWISFQDDEHQTEEELTALAKEKMDSVGKLGLYINNKLLDDALWTYRIQPPAINMTLPPNNILNTKPGVCTIVTDGFWILFEPLVETIKITSVGACSLGVTEISVNYDIKLI